MTSVSLLAGQLLCPADFTVHVPAASSVCDMLITEKCQKLGLLKKKKKKKASLHTIRAWFLSSFVLLIDAIVLWYNAQIKWKSYLWLRRNQSNCDQELISVYYCFGVFLTSERITIAFVTCTHKHACMKGYTFQCHTEPYAVKHIWSVFQE